MNFEAYRIFYYTAKYQNITGASKALFLTQPTVSHAIAGLERELGCQLFIRSKKGVQLTPEAELLYRHLSKAFQHVQDGERSLKDHLSLSEGQIRIGASETTLHYFLLPYLEQFRAAHPHIRLKISNTTTPAALHALREHTIDFAVIIAPVADASITIHELMEIKDIFIAGSQFAQLKNVPLGLSDLTAYPIVSMEPGTGTRKHLEHLFSNIGCPFTPDIELATTDLITPMVAHNLGIGFVPYSFAESSLKNGSVFQLNITDPLPRRSICIAVNKEFPLSVAAEKMVSLLGITSNHTTS